MKQRKNNRFLAMLMAMLMYQLLQRVGIRLLQKQIQIQALP